MKVKTRPKVRRVTVVWERHASYDTAKVCKHVIYLHEWNGLPCYWGEAADFAKRYRPGYRHWIEGCLRHGGRLYIGELGSGMHYSIKDIQYGLIDKYGSELNEIRPRPTCSYMFVHRGAVPVSIREHRSSVRPAVLMEARN